MYDENSICTFYGREIYFGCPGSSRLLTIDVNFSVSHGDLSAATFKFLCYFSLLVFVFVDEIPLVLPYRAFMTVVTAFLFFSRHQR